ncbi:MAG TPA: endonuclease/exonuclease/phosphatase family protein [Bacteroidales bacterium]|nr:endonuclease/exonuclease/phosphatase family protein [Bacteroidales bacterium]
MTALLKKKKKSSSVKARTRTEKPFLTRLLYRIMLVVNIAFGLALLMSYLAVNINPVDFALPAFFGLAYPYILLCNIIIVIAWAMLLRFEALISVVLISVGIGHFLNYIQLFRTKEDKTGTFKVMSYNVHMFNYFDADKLNATRKNVMNLIKRQKPDIACMQEFFVSGNPSSAENIVTSATGLKYNSHIKLLGKGKNRFYGIATYTRYPIIKKGEIIHPASSSLTIFTDVLIGRDTFRIYNNHLQSFRLKKMERSFIEEFTSSDNRENDVRNLSSRLRKGFISRSIQAQNVKDHIKRSPYPVIVLGDFNDTPVSYVYRKIRKGLNDSFVNSGYGAGFTYKGNYPPNRIDYILYDKALLNNYFEIIKVRYSDHYPIAAYFRKNIRKEAS